MIRLHLIAEGRTEEAFAKKILSPHLADYSVVLDARCVCGITSYGKPKQDIETWIKQDNHSTCRWTTMFDLYALPDDFPEYEETRKTLDPYARVAQLENALAADINDRRFIPYIQLHEFEALVFSDPQKLDWEYLEHDSPIKGLVDIALKQPNPELIDDGEATAPSKRILSHIPEYDKATAGVNVTSQIGLPKLREKCHHFNEWLTTLENLGKTGATP